MASCEIHTLASTLGRDTEISAEDIEQNLQEQKDEILALESIFTDTDRLRILSNPANEESTDGNSEADSTDATPRDVDQLFIIQVDVVVHLDDPEVTVEAWMPYEQQVDDASPTNAASLSPPNKPQFQRTVSGRRWYASFKSKHLIPLSLEVVLPKSYPSLKPPMFTLSCLWLNHEQLSTICKELDKIWEDCQGIPIVYTWIDWLQNNTLSTLGIRETVYLVRPVWDTDQSNNGLDPRGLPECNKLEEAVHRLLTYDHKQTYEDFMQNHHTCGVCFDEKLGNEFFKLDVCQHHFCGECMVAYCELHVKEGTVRQLSCPDPDCKETLPQGILQAVLEEEDYDRWERLLLQNTLDTMGDIVWCPRCNNAVIRDEDAKLQLAFCTTCSFSFCTNCKDPWHQGNKCEGDESEEDEAEDGEMTDLAMKKRLTKLATRRTNRMNKLSREMIQKTTKPCPICNVPIEKDSGCNKVTCTNCYKCMCWICGQSIKGYDHFGTCSMWTNDTFVVPVFHRRRVPEGAMNVRMHLQQNRGEDTLVHCPRCRQRNLKLDRNNHIRCWACHAHFCNMCKTVITPPITSHYMAASACIQHSD